MTQGEARDTSHAPAADAAKQAPAEKCVLPPSNHAYRKTARDWRTRRPRSTDRCPRYPGLPLRIIRHSSAGPKRPGPTTGGGAPSAGAAVKAEEHTRRRVTNGVGVRYSFALRGSDGQNQEVSRAIAARSREPVRLLVETTQDGYLQLLQNLGSAGTRLWWPPQETGKISLKAVARTRTDIPLPPPAKEQPA